jgi:hypothetical protein
VSSTNLFSGGLPFELNKLRLLEKLNINVQTLSGPLPAFYTASKLNDCDFSLGDYCREWDFTSASRNCDFESVPVCNSDCMVLYEWIEFSPGNCCSLL